MLLYVHIILLYHIFFFKSCAEAILDFRKVRIHSLFILYTLPGYEIAGLIILMDDDSDSNYFVEFC